MATGRCASRPCPFVWLGKCMWVSYISAHEVDGAVSTVHPLWFEECITCTRIARMQFATCDACNMHINNDEALPCVYDWLLHFGPMCLQQEHA